MLPFDLHVLGLPPAFTLSQDQTLHLKLHGPKAKLLQLQSPSSSPTRCTLYLRTNTLNHVICSNVCDGQLPPPDARTSHLRTLSKIANQASAPRFNPRRNHFRPREPHIIQGFY